MLQSRWRVVVRLAVVVERGRCREIVIVLINIVSPTEFLGGREESLVDFDVVKVHSQSHGRCGLCRLGRRTGRAWRVLVRRIPVERPRAQVIELVALVDCAERRLGDGNYGIAEEGRLAVTPNSEPLHIPVCEGKRRENAAWALLWATGQ